MIPTVLNQGSRFLPIEASSLRVHREQEANEHAIDRGEALNRIALPGPKSAALRRLRCRT